MGKLVNSGTGCFGVFLDEDKLQKPAFTPELHCYLPASPNHESHLSGGDEGIA
jgi:hypothetical protein